MRAICIILNVTNVGVLTSMVVLIPFSTEDSDPGADGDERGVVGADERMDPENTGEEDDMDKEDELAGESTRMGAQGDLDRVCMA